MSKILSVITAVIAFLIVLKTMFISLSDRVHDIGILKAIGWSNREVQKELLVETVIITVTGAIAGIVVSLLLSFLISTIPLNTAPDGRTPPVSSMEFAGQIKESQLPLIIIPGLLLNSFAATLFIGLFTGFMITRKSLKIKPVEVLRKI
jgi:putative ABC transport system permease protein